MIFRLAADLTVTLHLLFVVFVVTGGFLALRWPKAVYLHIPTAVWGALIEFTGWICPLTPLENYFRRVAGEAGYEGGFLNHYLVPILYPAGLTAGMQVLLGLGVILVNATAYGLLLARRRKAAC